MLHMGIDLWIWLESLSNFDFFAYVESLCLLVVVDLEINKLGHAFDVLFGIGLRHAKEDSEV